MLLKTKNGISIFVIVIEVTFGEPYMSMKGKNLENKDLEIGVERTEFNLNLSISGTMDEEENNHPP